MNLKFKEGDEVRMSKDLGDYKQGTVEFFRELCGETVVVNCVDSDDSKLPYEVDAVNGGFWVNAEAILSLKSNSSLYYDIIKELTK